MIDRLQDLISLENIQSNIDYFKNSKNLIKDNKKIYIKYI